jgi:integrase
MLKYLNQENKEYYMLEDASLAFSWDEIIKMIELARVNHRDFTLLSTMALSGRRISEIVGRTYKVDIPLPGLYIKDIDFGYKVIRWTLAKKFKKEGGINYERVTKLKEANEDMLSILKKYIDTLPPGQEKVFPITQQRAWQIVKKYMKQAGINRKRICHAFRHGFGIEFANNAEKPEDMMQLKDILDHYSIDQTSQYLRFAKTRKREILNSMSLSRGHLSRSP